MFDTFWSSLKDSFLHLTYPAKCLHCFSALSPSDPYLCNLCGNLLQRLNPEEHCSFCFCPLEQEEKMRCEECLRYPSSYFRRGAVFSYEGVATTLVKKLKYHNQPYLAKGMGAYLYLQWECLGWSIPDLIVPTPLSFLRRLTRGYNQSFLLAEQLGKLLNRPVWNVLKRSHGGYSQAALSLEQRQKLEKHQFQLKTHFSLMNKKILVIDDVMTSGATLERCAETLALGSPSALYALTFCKTILRECSKSFK